ncbi:MAG: hypothetical protein JWL77_2002, partial [Chthonomonadaceae bacterium]|nr:hypothetical protein [Chthonomonadaceae bacterium]
MKCLFTFWSLVLVSFTLSGVAQSRTVTRDLSEPPRPSWMVSDAGLQTVVSLDVSGKPLRNVLANLSRQYEINIQPEQALADYRVCLHARNQPLNKIMGRLQDLFGHGTQAPRSCEWARVVEGAKQPVYYLRRTRHGIDEEEALLDTPRQTCLRWMKEFQRYLRLPKEEQAKFQAECPCLRATIRNGDLDGDVRPLGEAFAALADGQIEALMENGSVDLPGLVFSPEAQGVLKEFPEPPPGIPKTFSSPDRSTPGAGLRLEGDTDCDKTGAYFLRVGPHNGTYCTRSFIFDTQRQYTGLLDTEEMLLPPIEKQGPVIDLLAHRQSQDSTNPVSMSLEKALGLLAQESGLNLYTEVFPRWPIPVDQTKGTPEQLLTLLCGRAGYRWRKVGNDVLVYSRSWASDRQANIPQPLLDRWLANFVKNGRHVLPDLLEMARLRDAQVKNLSHWMDVGSPLSLFNLGCLRLLGALAPAEVQFAYDPQGQTIGTLDASSLAFVQKEFKQQASLPIRVFIRRDPDLPTPIPGPDGKPGVRKSVTVTLQDQSGMTKSYFIIEQFLRPWQLMGPVQ